MQDLVFESAWDKTIAPADRERIVQLFHETKSKSNESVAFVPIRQARNHERCLLVTVLIHNFTENDFAIENMRMNYLESSRPVAEHEFSFPHIKVSGKTSMPWTFIFPYSSLMKEPTLQDGELRMSM